MNIVKEKNINRHQKAIKVSILATNINHLESITMHFTLDGQKKNRKTKVTTTKKKKNFETKRK